MVTLSNIREIFDSLVADENFCRLVYYGSNPFSIDKTDVHDMPDYEDLMKNIIRFSPQIEQLQNREEVRIMLFKSFTSMKYDKSYVRDNLIQLDIFIPHFLQQEDFRVYQIEDKIISILDKKVISGLGELTYKDGRFASSPIDNYSLYKMTFSNEEGRNLYGKL